MQRVCCGMRCCSKAILYETDGTVDHRSTVALLAVALRTGFLRNVKQLPNYVQVAGCDRWQVEVISSNLSGSVANFPFTSSEIRKLSGRVVTLPSLYDMCFLLHSGSFRIAHLIRNTKSRLAPSTAATTRLSTRTLLRYDTEQICARVK